MNQAVPISVFSWNVRWLNARPKRLAVRKAIWVEKPEILTLQETKMGPLNKILMREICGQRFNAFEELPADGTRGGILLAWNDRRYTKVSSQVNQYSITVQLKHNWEAMNLTVTAVYGPTNQRDRHTFFEELRQAKPQGGIPWIIGGDFNATATPDERTTDQNTWRSTLAFGSLISELELKNLPLEGQNYIWSNERDRPHMARLDRFIISTDWDTCFPNSRQRAMANTSSDHCPIILTAKTKFIRSRIFRFENAWLRSPALQELVKEEWESTPIATTPKDLDAKLNSLKQRVSAWAKEKIGNINSQIQSCREFIAWIGKAKELRQLTNLEKFITAIIKKRHTELAVLEEDIWRQRARTKWELQGD